MNTLLIVRALILLGIVAPLIPSTNEVKCHYCNANIARTANSEKPDDPCFLGSNDHQTDCPLRRFTCKTTFHWFKLNGTITSITRDCTERYENKYGEGCREYLLGDHVSTDCYCGNPGCNNVNVNELIGLSGTGGAEGGGDGEPDPNKALGVLVGPSFGTLVMGLLLGVGGALLRLLFQ